MKTRNLRVIKECDQRRVRSPFRIIETMETFDGPRDRVCDGSWETEEAAKAYIHERLTEWLTNGNV